MTEIKYVYYVVFDKEKGGLVIIHQNNLSKDVTPEYGPDTYSGCTSYIMGDPNNSRSIDRDQA